MSAHLMLPRLRKLLLWSLGVAIALVVLLTAAVLLAERLIDTSNIRAQLSDKLSRSLNGRVTWEHLHVRLLPLPHGVVQGVHVAIPNLVTMEVAMADVKLRLLPLLHGNTELKTLTLERPNVDVWISAAAAPGEATEQSPKPSAPLALYRSAMRPVLDAVARFAPNTTVAIEDGRVGLHLFDRHPFEASKLKVQIVTDDQGVALDASASGTYWDRVAIDGRVEFADLRAFVKLEGSGLKLQQALEAVLTNIRESLVLSDVGAKFEARTDGHTDIDVALGIDLPKAAIRRRAKQLDIAQVRLAGSIKFIADDVDVALDEVHLGELADAGRISLLLSGAKRTPKLDIAISELDLSRLRDATLTLAGNQPAVKAYATRIHGGRLRDVRFSTQAEDFAQLFALSHLRGSAQLADGSIRVPTLEREATEITARAELLSGVINVGDVSVRLGASQLRQAEAVLVLLKPMRLEHTRGQATIVLNDLLPGLRAREPFARLLRSIPTITGVAQADVRNLALRFDEPSQVAYDLNVSPQHVLIETEKLPGPAELHGGTVRVTSKAINVNHIGIKVLDSTATLSGDVTDFQSRNLRVRARVADGVAKHTLIDWIWLRTALAEQLKPATPLRFAAQRVQWSDAGLDVVAEVNINAGPSLSVDLSRRDKTFTLRRATIKDHDSDANVSFARRESLVEVGFAGVLAARSLARILGRSSESYLGSVRGDIQATVDLSRQGRSMARGQLAGGRIDLQELIGMPLKLGRLDMQGDGDALRIRELTMAWAEQKATIRGAVAREANELAMTLEIDSPGIEIDALRGTPTTKAASAPAEKQNKPEKTLGPWSLPLKGTVSLRADFVEYHGFRVQGLRAVATLGHETAAVDVTEASLCGLTVPPSLRMTPKEFDAHVNVTVKDQLLENVVQCFTGKDVIISGNVNMTSVLAASGPAEHIAESLAEHLAGSVNFSARDGEIFKAALLGNILSLKSVSNLTKGDVSLGGRGFKYRTIAVDARIEKGRIIFHQATLDSPALGLAATGTINLQNYESRLTVLVAPFSTVDRVVRKIPILGYVIGGAFTSVPVGITGDIRKPLVAPLGPRAVGSEVRGVFERTFKLPGKMGEALGTKPSQ